MRGSFLLQVVSPNLNSSGPFKAGLAEIFHRNNFLILFLWRQATPILALEQVISLSV